MKASLNWLREFVELPPTVDALVALLTMAGVEVEDIATTGCAIPDVVVAQIRASVQHPNADRLSVCQVDDGSGHPRQIVCGAKNYRVGDKVPLALPGAKLGTDFTIKVGKLRGVESQGMLCSAEELGLPKGEDGLLILPPDAKIGTPIGDLFPGDTVLDLEITPNRPDLLSMVGLAREVAALSSLAWNDSVTLFALEMAVPNLVRVTAAECSTYTARKISGVKVGPSPEWLRQRIEAAGIRAINNIVDISNYVMLEVGQPLHVFDAAKLDGALNVRLAQPGESLHALDGKSYRLGPSHIVIADEEKVVAIAGVMGGEATGVTGTTTEVWLESALFGSQSVRRTSRELGLASDSSYRFERRVDGARISEAAQRAVQLIAELAGGVASPPVAGFPPGSSFSEDASVDFGGAIFTRNVLLRPERVEAVLGVPVSVDRIERILSGFGLEARPDGHWRIPSFRPDLTREVDLIEEVARVIGMEAIPAKTQARFAPASASDRAYDRAMTLRRALVAQGLHEARSLTLVPAKPLGLAAAQTAPENLLRVKNPMIDDQVVLRANLLHGLLSAVRGNLRNGGKSVRLFEIGRTFRQQRPQEAQHAAVVITGPIVERTWRNGEGADADLFTLKGILAAVLGEETTFVPEENPALALALAIQMNGQPVGIAGQLWPAEARALDATAPVLFAELDLVALEKARGTDAAKKYRDIPRFPATSRDIALLAPADLPHARIEAALRDAQEPLLAAVELFDVFTDPAGVKVPAGQRSLAYSLTYRSPERTLAADEVNAAHSRLKDRLRSLGVTPRE